VTFHEDVFYEYFRPFRHPSAKFDIWGGYGLETFGEDLLLVRRYAPVCVWTVIDGEQDQWIVPGYNYVNRVCYVLTELPHNQAQVEFRIAQNSRSLTPLGLTRRIVTLRRIVAHA